MRAPRAEGPAHGQRSAARETQEYAQHRECENIGVKLHSGTIFRGFMPFLRFRVYLYIDLKLNRT